MAKSCDACNRSWAQVKRAGPAPLRAPGPVCRRSWLHARVCVPTAPFAKEV